MVDTQTEVGDYPGVLVHNADGLAHQLPHCVAGPNLKPARPSLNKPEVGGHKQKSFLGEEARGVPNHLGLVF